MAFKLVTLLISTVAYPEAHMQLVGMLIKFYLQFISSAPQYSGRKTMGNFALLTV